LFFSCQKLFVFLAKILKLAIIARMDYVKLLKEWRTEKGHDKHYMAALSLVFFLSELF